ncbi:MAG: SAM-dependent methyltransferase [Patescibacteria group bacterium]
MFIILFILLIIVVVVTIIIFYLLFIGMLFYVPWVPLSQKEVERILSLAEIQPNDVLYDLGSGDGRIIIKAAQKYKIKKAVGIEIAWPLVLWSKLKVKLAGLGAPVQVKCGNLYKADISEATIVVLFLMPEAIEKLIPKLKKELRPGTKIISAVFKINNWPALKIDRPRAKDKPIYLHTKI